MQKFVLEQFDFIPFTGIGFISTFIDRPILRYTTTHKLPFEFCFPLMIERWYSEANEEILLEPKAKFEMSFGRRRWIETYYYTKFVFKRQNEAIYDEWRKRFFPEIYLSSLKDYDEVEVFVYFITVFDPRERGGEEDYSLVHNFNENFYILPKNKSENLYVLSKTDGEQNILEYIDDAVKTKMTKLLKKSIKPLKKVKVLHLNEQLQKVYEEQLNKFLD